MKKMILKTKIVTRALPVILTAALFLQCASEKQIEYNIPVTATEKQRNDLLEQCKKGRELYKANCGECHGIFTRGKDSIPNFSSTQIDNYSARFLRHDPKNHAVIKKMSPEQMNEVLMFLRYRKLDKKKPKQLKA